MKRFIIMIFNIFTGILVYSQIDSNFIWHRALTDASENLYEILEAQNLYFENHPDTTADESGNRAEYYRWSDFWKRRAYSEEAQKGSILNGMSKYMDAVSHINEYYGPTENPASDWYFVGPKGLSSQNYGVVGCIAVDPSDQTHNTIYAGSGASGLWKTIDGGNSWRNITGNYLIAGLGVMDILINPTNPQIIYITIGFGSMGRTYCYS
jgi:hypothetical protein